MIYRPLSEALSLGCDIYKPHAKMIVHFGDAATEISVIAMGGIVASKTVPVSVNTFAEDMCDYISRNYNVQIDIKTAKDMLTNYWSFPTGKSRSRKKEYSVAGSAESIEMSYVDVSKALGNSLDKIEKAVFTLQKRRENTAFLAVIAMPVLITGKPCRSKDCRQPFLQRHFPCSWKSF